MCCIPGMGQDQIWHIDSTMHSIIINRREKSPVALRWSKVTKAKHRKAGVQQSGDGPHEQGHQFAIFIRRRLSNCKVGEGGGGGKRELRERKMGGAEIEKKDTQERSSCYPGIKVVALIHNAVNGPGRDDSTSSSPWLCATSQKTRGIHPMVFQCWATVEDGGPTWKHHWVNASSTVDQHWNNIGWMSRVGWDGKSRSTHSAKANSSKPLLEKYAVTAVHISRQIHVCHANANSSNCLLEWKSSYCCLFWAVFWFPCIGFTYLHLLFFCPQFFCTASLFSPFYLHSYTFL